MNLKHKLSILSLISLVSFPTVVANAQETLPQTLPQDNQETQSETTIEDEEKDDNQQEYDLDITITDKILNQPLYTPFRQESTLRESTRPAYVINREQIEAQQFRTVQEALKYVPGITIEGTAGGQLGASSGQRMRGSRNSQNLILLDGRPINDLGFFGGFDLSEFSTDNVERIEIVPGGSSTLYGSNAIGGVINIITRSPEIGTSGAASLTLGSFDYNQQTLSLNQGWDNLGLFFSYDRIYSDNDFPFELDSINFDDQRDNAQVLYNNVNAKLTANIGDRNTITFNTLYLNKNLNVPGGIPIDDPELTVGAYNSLTPNAEQYTEQILMDLGWESKFGKGDNSILTARVYSDFLNYNYTNPDGFFPTEDEVDRNSTGFQVQHSWQVAANQNLTYGFDYRHISADNKSFDVTNYNDTIDQGALFARYNLDIGEIFTINLGLRQDFNSLADGSFTSPSVGAKLNLGKTTSIRANYARNFRVPTAVDLYYTPYNNPDLDPEIGNSFDVGFDQQLGDIGLLRFTFFINDIEDAINFNLDTYTPDNVGRVKTTGIETELNLRLWKNLYAFANYTLNNPKIKEDQNEDIEGNELPFAGADVLNVGLAYENARGFYTGLIVRYVSDFFVNNDNTESLNGYTTLDWKFRFPITKSFTINASWDNILNEQYEVFPGYPGVGSSFQVGISSKF